MSGPIDIPAITMPNRNRRGGFVVFDHVARFDAANRALADRYQAGRLVYDEDISDGIEHAPGAIKALHAGENRGKKLIFVG